MAARAPRPLRPSPRPSLLDETLTRPDWTAGVPRDPGVLWLDKNENIDPQLAAVTARVMAEIDPTVIYSYPDSTLLYRKLGASLGVGAERLLLTAGSDGAIRAVFEAYVELGDAVVHTVPTFAMYSVYCQMYGARQVGLDYRPSDDGPCLDASTIVAAIVRSRPKLVCLPNPDSPTGTVFPPDELRRIVEAASEVGALVLIDEAYFPFYDWTALSWTDEYPHLVVARTFAKAWGLAGLRIGYAIASPDVARLLHKVRPMYEVSTVAVAAVERMLDFADEMRASVRRLNAGRDVFLSAMKQLGFRTLRAHGNFLHVAFGAHAPRVHAALKDVVRYRLDFREPCLAGFSRFSSTAPELFQRVIDPIRRVTLTSD